LVEQGDDGGPQAEHPNDQRNQLPVAAVLEPDHTSTSAATPKSSPPSLRL
jgi:hypothetical protein